VIRESWEKSERKQKRKREEKVKVKVKKKMLKKKNNCFLKKSTKKLTYFVFQNLCSLILSFQIFKPLYPKFFLPLPWPHYKL